MESSVTISWQSVWLMSRASSAPRRVGLMPTTAAPASPAPSNRNTNSGTFSSSTPTWNGPGRRSCDEQLGAHARFLDDLAPRPPSILVEEPVGVVVRPAQDQLGERRRRAVHYPSHASGIACMPRTRLDATHCGSPATT